MSNLTRRALVCLVAILAPLSAHAIDVDCGGGPCSPLTTDEKRAILDLHNELRDRVAAGLIPGMPPAADMNSLVWDDGLQTIAQTYANSCPGLAHNAAAGIEYLMLRNLNQTNLKWGPDSEFLPSSSFCFGQDCILVGENILGSFSVLDLDGVLSLIETRWWEQYQDWTFGPHDMGCQSGQQCGAFTQLAWANARYVGCGYVNGCPDGNLFLCNYFPAGNFAPVEPYTPGIPCSDCMPDRTFCQNALCGGGMCPTICDGASVDRLTCDGYPTCGPPDCNDGTTSTTRGRDICSTGGTGSVRDLRASGHDPATGAVSLSYWPACFADQHNVIFGPLADVSTYGYSGATCSIGRHGSHQLSLPGPGSFFFLVVGESDFHNSNEGSYGTSSDSVERPTHPVCAAGQMAFDFCPF